MITVEFLICQLFWKVHKKLGSSLKEDYENEYIGAALNSNLESAFTVYYTRCFGAIKQFNIIIARQT